MIKQTLRARNVGLVSFFRTRFTIHSAVSSRFLVSPWDEMLSGVRISRLRSKNPRTRSTHVADGTWRVPRRGERFVSRKKERKKEGKKERKKERRDWKSSTYWIRYSCIPLTRCLSCILTNGTRHSDIPILRVHKVRVRKYKVSRIKEEKKEELYLPLRDARTIHCFR